MAISRAHFSPPYWTPYLAAADPKPEDLEGIDIHFVQESHSLFSKTFTFVLEIANHSSHTRQVIFHCQDHVNVREIPHHSFLSVMGTMLNWLIPTSSEKIQSSQRAILTPLLYGL